MSKRQKTLYKQSLGTGEQTPAFAELPVAVEVSQQLGQTSDAKVETTKEIESTLKQVTKLMTTNGKNSWELGDAFVKLADLKHPIRAIADHVKRGKSFVDVLVQTARRFPSEKRTEGYSWFTHDLYRRGYDATEKRMKSENITVVDATTFDQAAILKAIEVGKARNTQAASAAIVDELVKQEQLTAEQAKTILAPMTAIPSLYFIKDRLTFMAVRVKPQRMPSQWKDTVNWKNAAKYDVMADGIPLVSH